MEFEIEAGICPSDDKPLPTKYVLFFRCPNCKAVSAIVFAIKHIDLKYIRSFFILPLLLRATDRRFKLLFPAIMNSLGYNWFYYSSGYTSSEINLILGI